MNTTTQQHAVVSTETPLRETFDAYVTTYKEDIKLLANKRHKSFDLMVAILWRKYQRDHTKHTANTIKTAKENNQRAGLIVEPKSVDWTDIKVAKFAKWYCTETQPRVQNNVVVKANLKITNDKYSDSLQDAFLYYLAHMDLISDDATDLEYKMLLLSKAKYLRLDIHRRESGLMSNGQVSKTHGRYPHIQNTYNKDGDNYIYNNSGEEPTGITIKGVSVA